MATIMGHNDVTIMTWWFPGGDYLTMMMIMITRRPGGGRVSQA